MQFEMTATVFGCNKVTVDGNTYCSMFTGQQPIGDNAAKTVGLEVTKISAEPEVFDQLKAQNFQSGQDIKLVAIIKKAAQGKSQPHVIGVVPIRSAPQNQPEKKAG